MKNKYFEYILNPAKYIAGFQGVLAAVIVCFALSALGTFYNVSFDGVLDMHIATGTNSFLKLVFQNLIDWAVLSAVFYVVAILFKSKIRLIDAFGILVTPRIILTITIIISRLLQNVIQFNPSESASVLQSKILTLGSFSYVLLFIYAIILLLSLVLMLVMLYNCYKTISNLKNGKIIASFIISIIIAEVLSKWLIYTCL